MCGRYSRLNMFVEISLPTSLRTLAVASAILVASLVLKRLLASKVQKKNSRYEMLPPFVTTGIIDGIKILTSEIVPIAILERYRKYGYKYFQLHVPQNKMVFVTSDFEVCKDILYDRSAQQAPLYMDYKMMHDGGNDIFTSDGTFWKHSRKGIAPAFSSTHICRMNEVVLELTEKFIHEKLNIFAKTGESFDVFKELLNLTASAICKAAFEYDITDNEKLTYFNDMTVVLNEIRMARIPLRWHFGSFIPAVQQGRQAGRNIIRFGMHILDSYKKLQKPTKGTAISHIVNNPNYKTDKVRMRLSRL